MIPPLRNRKEDIPSMANYFVAEFSRRMGRHITGISKEALEKLHVRMVLKWR